MGPRSDERGNSRCRNPLIVKELQPTCRAIPPPANILTSSIGAVQNKFLLSLGLRHSSGPGQFDNT